MAATHPSDRELDNFLLGKFPDPDPATVEEHLASCPVCQNRAADRTAGDTLTELLAAARTQAAADRAAAPTPAPAGSATPSLFAPTQGWDEGTPVPADGEAPPALAGHSKYRVLRRLGTGGMGTVWLAEHAVMNRLVAVKVIRPDLLARPGATERFLREVRAAAKLHHPHIVTAFDAEPVGDSCLLVMEYVPGETLGDRVTAGPLPVAEACRAVRDAARGLAHAHAAGLIHRDVKPHNLIRAPDGTTKVLDFGLAGVVAGEVVAAGGDGLTGTGMVAGTPDYIAPEQAADPRAADARADIYGLGCTLYHLLAGRPPFPDGSVVEKLKAQETREPDSIPGLPAGVGAVLAKMLAKRPEDRYQSADEVAAAMDRCIRLTDPARRRRRRQLAVVAGLLAAALLVAAAVVFKIQRDNQEITIATDDPDIEVVVKRKGEVVRIIDKKGGQVWEYDGLRNQIALADTPDGLALTLPEGATVVMRRRGEKDGKPAFTIARLPKPGEVRRFEGHTDVVQAAVFSPDRRRILSCAGHYHRNDFVVRLWDADTGRLLRRLEGHTESVYAVAFSPDGKRAVSGSSDRTVRLWDLETGRELCRFTKHAFFVCSVAFSPDGTQVLSAGGDGPRLWEVETGKELRRFTGHPGTVMEAVFSHDGKRVISVGEHGSAILWEAETGRTVRELTGHTGLVYSAAFSPNGKRAVTGSDDKTVRAWDLDTGKELYCLRWPNLQVYSVAVSPDGRRVLIGGLDEKGLETLRLADAETGREVPLSFRYPGAVWGVSFSPDGRHALTAGADTTVRLWRLPDLPARKP